MTQLPLGLRLNDHAVFENYYPGANTQVVRHLSTLVASGGTPVIWIYGAVSTGKSHLLQAVCARAASIGRKAAYLPLAHIGEMTPDVLQGWQDIDVLCIDDVHLLAGQAVWERALFNTFNDVAEGGGAMVAAADGSPASAGFELPDLLSRMSWGAVYRLQPLGDDERLSALMLRAENRGLELPEETGRYLMNRLPRDMTTLYALLDTLDTASLAAQRKLTVPFVRSVLDLKLRRSPGDKAPG